LRNPIRQERELTLLKLVRGESLTDPTVATKALKRTGLFFLEKNRRNELHLSVVGDPRSIFEWWSWVLSIPDVPRGNHPGRGGNIFQQQTRPFFCQICTIETGTALARAYNNTAANRAKQIMIPVLTSEATVTENPDFTDDQLLHRAEHDLINPQVLFLNVDNEYILKPRLLVQIYIHVSIVPEGACFQVGYVLVESMKRRLQHTKAVKMIGRLL
jgi:hypothetical protein